MPLDPFRPVRIVAFVVAGRGHETAVRCRPGAVDRIWGPRQQTRHTVMDRQVASTSLSSSLSEMAMPDAAM